ncbi:hypothetical protein [Vibrio alfacsensis]|uniref:hypothetical protein n=1 Tax=Vibrio alfacsensis TaxID=1074311 RepID=UPI0040681208
MAYVDDLEMDIMFQQNYALEYLSNALQQHGRRFIKNGKATKSVSSGLIAKGIESG